MKTREQIYNENKAAVLASPIVAKAVIRRPDGRVEIVILYKMSTVHECFWTYTAKGPRSARKTWKYSGHFNNEMIQTGVEEPRRRHARFEGFVSCYCNSMGGTLVSVRYLKKRAAFSVMAKPDHGSIGAEWAPQRAAVSLQGHPNRSARSVFNLAPWPGRLK